MYSERREELSRFPWLGKWTQELTTPEFQSSEQPYEDFLREHLKFDDENNDMNSQSSWWTTELHGWAGGMSQSAKTVDISIRKSYAEGFSPLTDTPPQRRVEEDDIQRANTAVSNPIGRNSVGLLNLTSWEQYYTLRNIPSTSPVALLCTFPLTIYYAITHCGEVPCTVAQMLKRPLRVHIVGVEKEANFLDLFQEVGYLLPKDFLVRTKHCEGGGLFDQRSRLTLLRPSLANRSTLHSLFARTCFRPNVAKDLRRALNQSSISWNCVPIYP